MIDKKNFKVFGIFFAVVIMILGMYFVMAAEPPTYLTFDQNTTDGYDNDGTFTVNWTNGSTGDFNYTIYIYADDVLYNTLAENDSTTGYSFTNTTEANYTFTVEAENSTGKTNSTYNISMIVDTTNPVISYESPTEADSASKSQTWIFVNVSATDTNNDSLVYSLYNSTGGLEVQNITNYTVTTINWTSLSEGTYTYNVTANDSATNVNGPGTRTITLDTTAPSAPTLSSSSSTSNSLTITITGVDGTCTATGSGTKSISGSTLTVTGLSCGASYSYIVTCTDNAGNVGTSSSSTSFSTSGCGGGSGGGTTSFWTMNYMEDDEELSVKVNVNKELKEKQRIKLKVIGETRYVGIVELTGTTATLNVSSGDGSSMDQQITFSIGDTKKFEVTGDNFYDLSVTLNGIADNKADLTVVFISEEITAETEEEISEGVTEEGETTEGEEERKGKAWLWIIVALVVIGIGFALYNKQKKAKRFGMYGF